MVDVHRVNIRERADTAMFIGIIKGYGGSNSCHSPQCLLVMETLRVQGVKCKRVMRYFFGN